MKKTAWILSCLCVAAILCGCGSETTQQPEKEKISAKGIVWMTDFEVAKSQAKISGKPILLVFSGSDWCTWCIKLDKEVFSTDEFKNWAADNVITVIADFPTGKTLPDEVVKQNNQLQTTYNVAGFPTVFLLRDDGSVIAKTGYQRGGVAAYIRHLKMFLGANK